MSDEWKESTEVEETISRVEGRPKSEDRELTRRDIINFDAVSYLVGKKLKQGGELAELYVRSKVAQEENAAAKASAEAAEIASRKEESEARTDIAKQEAVGKFVQNVKEIADLPPAAQMLAMAKMMAENPDIAEQLDHVEYVASKLRLKHNAIIERSTAGLISDADGGDSAEGEGSEAAE